MIMERVMNNDTITFFFFFYVTCKHHILNINKTQRVFWLLPIFKCGTCDILIRLQAVVLKFRIGFLICTRRKSAGIFFFTITTLDDTPNLAVASDPHGMLH